MTLYEYKKFWIQATDFIGFTSQSDWWLVQWDNLTNSFLTFQIFLKKLGFNAYELVCIVSQISYWYKKNQRSWKRLEMDLY